MTRINCFFFILLISSLTLFTAVSCGDDSVSGFDESDIPAVPEFVNAYMADSIFTVNDPIFNVRKSASNDSFLERVYSQVETGELSPGTIRRHQNTILEDNNDLTNFEIAGALIREIRMSLQSVQFLYYQLFIPVIQRSPDFSDDTFIWEFELPVADSEMVLDTRITAEPTGSNGEFLWTMNIKGLYLDDTSVEVKTLEAISSFDGTTGSVQTSMPVLMGGEVFVSDLAWNVAQNRFMDLTFDFEFDDDELDQIRTGTTYKHDTEEATASLTNAWAFIENEFDLEFEIHWYLENNSGDATVNGEHICWDEEYQDTSCE